MYTFSVLLRVDDIDLVHIEVDIALCLRAEQSAVVRVLHNGIDIPHAALICALVVNDKFVLLALGIECALDGHCAVVSEPIALELDAVNRYSGYVAYKPARARHAAERIGRVLESAVRRRLRAAAGVGEIIYVLNSAYLGVELLRAVKREVIETVVVRESKAQDAAGIEARLALAGSAGQTELIELEVKVVAARHTRDIGNHSGDILAVINGNADIRADCAVMRRRYRDNGVYIIALSAFEELGDVAARRDLFGRAVCENIGEESRRCAAERVAEEIYLDDISVLVGLAEGVDKSFADKRTAVALMMMLRRVGCTVIDDGSRKLSIELARSVPCAAERTDGGRVAIVSARRERLHQILFILHTPVWRDGVELVVVSVAEDAVDEDAGIFVRIGLCVGKCKGNARAENENQSEQQACRTFKDVAFCHCFTSCVLFVLISSKY